MCGVPFLKTIYDSYSLKLFFCANSLGMGWSSIYSEVFCIDSRRPLEHFELKDFLVYQNHTCHSNSGFHSFDRWLLLPNSQGCSLFVLTLSTKLSKDTFAWIEWFLFICIFSVLTLCGMFILGFLPWPGHTVFLLNVDMALKMEVQAWFNWYP